MGFRNCGILTAQGRDCLGLANPIPEFLNLELLIQHHRIKAGVESRFDMEQGSERASWSTVLFLWAILEVHDVD